MRFFGLDFAFGHVENVVDDGSEDLGRKMTGVAVVAVFHPRELQNFSMEMLEKGRLRDVARVEVLIFVNQNRFSAFVRACLGDRWRRRNPAHHSTA